METFDVIVVGAGIMGHATAWHLVHKEGKSVLLLDQFSFPTTRNSSTGLSRIYRRSYDFSHYSAMMDAAIPLWKEIEILAGRSILHECGLINAGTDNFVDTVERTLKANRSPYERYSYAQLHQRWPHFTGFKDKDQFIYDPGAGYIEAAVAIQSYHNLLQSSTKCSLRFNTSVLSIDPSPKNDEARVITDKGTFQANSVVLTPGSWSGSLLQGLGYHLPLEPQRVAVAYFKLNNENDKPFRESRWPTFIYEDDEVNVYAIPEAEYPGMVKFGNHHGIAADPDRRDRCKEDLQQILQPMTDFIRDHLPGLEAEPAIIEHCMYCMTPDGNYVLDRHPHYTNIVIGCGFSGHGFKMAPVVGEILGNMTVGKEARFDLQPFLAGRFLPMSKL